MAIRPTVLIIAISLSLAGCNVRGAGQSAKRIAAQNGDHVTARPLSLAPSGAGNSGSAGYARRASVAGTPYALGSGDRLGITVFGQKNLSRSYSVDAGGFISMPLIGAVEARGISTFQLEERISRSLKRRYVKDPKVTVEVETRRPFFILGEVRNAGQYSYVVDMSVQTAVAIAGGFTPRAKKRSVQVTRRVNGSAVTRNVPVGWKIQPGDTITVNERFF